MNNKKTIYAVCLLLLVIVISVGYALISGTLNINGNAKITAASWEIYFKNVEIKDGSVVATQEPTITDKTSLSYNINLNTPGDYFEFNVDVVNNGDLDAMIDKITITPDISDKPYLEYTVKYLDDSLVEEKDILNSKKARTIKVRVEYLKTIENNELNKNDEELNIVFSMEYVQADATGKVPTAADKSASPWAVVTGDGTHVGDEIAIGDENFYVISNDGTNITMLAKYNLLVGYLYNGSTTTPLTNSTGIQDTTAKGYNGSNLNIGVIPFSSSQYWGNASYGTYIYNDKSSAKIHVDGYKNYLESLGAEIEEARLINYNELVNLGCNPSSLTCSSAPSWVRATSYWTGSVYGDYYVWVVVSDGDMYSNPYYFNYLWGVRPVIVISADAI